MTIKNLIKQKVEVPQMKLTIVIPAYNEENGIELTLRTLTKAIMGKDWKILVINDGSTDKTCEIAKEINGIEIINQPYNKGYGASLKTGIRSAKTEYVAFYDADGQHQPEDLIMLAEKIGNYDMLVGMRSKASHQDWLRKPGKWVLSKVANYLCGRKIPDLNSGLRIIKKNVIERMLHLFPDGFSFTTTSTVALINMGYNVGYMPITVKKRVGKSTVKQLKHGSAVILLMIRLIVLFNPLKVFLPFSIYLFILGTIYEIIFGIVILLPEKVKLIPAAFFMILTSILIFFFGLVVDQISELRKHIGINKINS
ncbi:MAG: glycosyltransferase family 2 protein [Desulfobacterales bacterium]|nr:glycosyltransferase family 2 protein [Desulfobacterales bacterium]